MASVETKLAILRAAETLFADKGIDSVSMREISLAAGQSNPSASGYHFGEKVNIIDAILDRHCVPIQESWIPILSVPHSYSIRDLVDLMTVPFVEKLDDEDNGVQYIHFATQLCNHPTWPLFERPCANAPGAVVLGQAMHDVLEGHLATTPLPPELTKLRVQRITNVMYNSICYYHRSQSTVPRNLFISDLVDVLTAVITSVSQDTIDVINEL